MEEEGVVAEEVVVEVDVALQVAVEEEDLVEAVQWEGVVEEVPWAEVVVEVLVLAGVEEDFRITWFNAITLYNKDM